MESSSKLEDCLKLLKGERDEQKLAGLLLVTKLFRADDHTSVLKVYEAVGTQFLDRLLMTGAEPGSFRSNDGEERAAYLRLSVAVLAAFCRVPGIASSEQMISKIPLLLQILSSQSEQSISEEIYEILFLIATSSEDGFSGLCDSGVVRAISSNITTLPDGSKSMEMAIKLVQLFLGKVPLDRLANQYKLELSKLVPTVARQLAFLHSQLKFDALHVLATIISTKDSDMKYVVLKPSYDETWPTHVLKGVLDILQNRVVSAEKLQALALSESMMSIAGEEWLLNVYQQPFDQKPFPVDKCLLLVLQTARVEVAVLLNEHAYKKYEAKENSSAGSLQLNLALLFSLLEKIIKLVSNVSQNPDARVNEETLIKVIGGLNETTALVLDFLQDARDHGDKKGDDLLAAVRIVGRYLAEAPLACKEKIRELLEYILSIEGGDERGAFSSIQFMLPMLCQLTMDVEGCKAITSFGGHKSVAEFLRKGITQNAGTCPHHGGTTFLAFDTILNILLNRDKLKPHLDAHHLVFLLYPLVSWAEGKERSEMMMASSICSLVLEFACEEFLDLEDDLDDFLLRGLSCLFVITMRSPRQVRGDDFDKLDDLRKIITSGYLEWGSHFTKLKVLIKSHLRP